MAIEAKRGCGYRKVGGLYLVGEGLSVVCDKLPYELKVCPCCGAGIKQARGFTWIKAFELFGIHQNCQDKVVPCPVCQPFRDKKYGLLWVGEKYYTPQSFIREAQQLGVSKRIPQIPKDLKLGETWILLAHPKAIIKATKDNGKSLVEENPGIFYAFRPVRVEKIITQKQATKKALKKLKKRGITPVIVPDGDKDHK